MDESWRREWGESEIGRSYGEVFYQRATGALPEMESSLALARRLLPMLRAGDQVLDVGCGAGHYYLTLKKQATVPFVYRGIDATASYIEKGRVAFADDRAASFDIGDIFALPVADR